VHLKRSCKVVLDALNLSTRLSYFVLPECLFLQMKSALRDQKESNLALRSYIDGILLNIVEHYPQLLEVKNKNVSSSNSGMQTSTGQK